MHNKRIRKAKHGAHTRHARPAAVAPTAPMTAGEVLGRARQAILQAVPEIVTALADGAKGGNHLQAKFLFEFAGLSAAEGSDAAAGQSLAEVLLAALHGADTAENGSHPSSCNGGRLE